ncbi:MAG: serine/threonine-protein kinase, partial [Myxococcota bacterium]
MTTADPPKRQVGGWQLLEVLGTGAFGETWRAQDPSGAQAAVKLLKGPPGNELRVLSRVVHPAIISVLEAGGTARPYLAMEYATGSTLAECATLTKAQHLQVIAALLDALAVLHAAGLTHGDVKPDNLMIDVQPNGEVQLKLIDFGLAGIGQGGTLAWAAPERLRGESATPQSDVYAAGLVLWTMLHGELPFSELAPEKMLLRRRSTPAVPSAGPEWVRDLLEAMVAVDPSQRPDAASLADAFAAHGVSLPTIDADWLRYRARSLQVPGPIDGVVERWLSSGGTSLVLGAPGSGKSLVVRRAIVELSARGATWVRLQSLGGPWSAVAAALEDPRLPEAPVSLPATRDPADRAYSAARQLLRRGGKGPLHVIV